MEIIAIAEPDTILTSLFSRQKAFELCDEARQAIDHRGPHDGNVDIEVRVKQAVAHAYYVQPRDVVIRRGECSGDLALPDL